MRSVIQPREDGSKVSTHLCTIMSDSEDKCEMPVELKKKNNKKKETQTIKLNTTWKGIKAVDHVLDTTGEGKIKKKSKIQCYKHKKG